MTLGHSLAVGFSNRARTPGSETSAWNAPLTLLRNFEVFL